MKKYISLLLFSIVSIVSFGQSAFPTRSIDTATVRIKDKVTTKKYSLEWALTNGSVKIQKQVNNLGVPANMSGGITTNLAWRTAAKPTVTANSWNNMALGFILPSAGKTIYIRKIAITTTGAATVGMRHFEDGTTYGLDGNTATNFTGAFWQRNIEFNTATTETKEIDFGKIPLKVRYKESISFFIYYPTTTGENWSIDIDAIETTNDENWDADFLFGVMGDSFCITSDTKEYEYSNRDGVIHGIWPFIARQHLHDNGINVLLSNMGLGGTNAPYWESRANTGLFTAWQPDILCVFLGRNDAGSVSAISTSVGTDAWYKKAIKGIARQYFRNVKKGCLIFCQTADTDVAAPLTLISGGMYNGLTQIAAIRLELIAAINELKAEHPEWDLHLADTSPGQTYLASDATNYVTAEQSVGSRTHANARIGQPKLAVKINQAISGSAFFGRNSN